MISGKIRTKKPVNNVHVVDSFILNLNNFKNLIVQTKSNTKEKLNNFMLNEKIKKLLA